MQHNVDYITIYFQNTTSKNSECTMEYSVFGLFSQSRAGLAFFISETSMDFFPFLFWKPFGFFVIQQNQLRLKIQNNVFILLYYLNS